MTIDPKLANENISCAELEQSCVEIGEMLFAYGWEHTDNEVEAWGLEYRAISERAKQGDRWALLATSNAYNASDVYNAIGWQSKWYRYGCQSIEVEEKYAASLCATKVPPSELEHVRLPWPCFMVRVPKFLQNILVNGEPLRLILVNHAHYSGHTKVTGELEGQLETEFYRLTLFTANKYRVLPAKSLLDWLAIDKSLEVTHYFDREVVELSPVTKVSEADRRQLEICGRLVLGAIITMNDPKTYKRLGPLPLGTKPSIGSPRYGTHNRVTLHKMGQPVNVDAREVISAYVSGKGGTAPNVRTLVAGYWRYQPHGPKNSLRRWQHIKCHWRGDKEAPLIVRPHVMRGLKNH